MNLPVRYVGLVACTAALAAASPAAAEPAVRFVSPAPGSAVHATGLRVEAVVSGPARITLDGRPLRRVRPRCAQEVVTIPVARLRPGRHVLSAPGDRVRFRVDRRLAPRPRNRIERAATPAPFACLSVRRDGRALRGTFRLSSAGDGRVGARDRVLVAFGGRSRVVRPAAVGLRRTGPRTYRFRLDGAARTAVALRVGDDWGTVDARGRRVARMPLRGVRSRRASARIGPQGGTLTARVEGARVRLQVPAGALRRRTRLSMTPLAASPLAGARQMLPGVHFEPEGLVFAKPALLTVEALRGTRRVRSGDRIFLATSPLSAVPLPGRADPARGTVSALLPHFSVGLPGLTDDEFTDLGFWADALLSATGGDTLFELAQLLELARLQEANGCSQGRCVDLAEVRERADRSLATLAGRLCVDDVLQPTDVAFEQWLVVLRAAEALGAAGEAARACAGQVLRALIVSAVGPGELEDADLARLWALADQAVALDSRDLEELALDRYFAILAERLLAIRARCGSTSAVELGVARGDLERLRGLTAALAARAPEVILGDFAGEIQALLDTCVPPVPSPTPPGPPAPPPPPVSADGCDADVAAPTDAALRHWVGVELAAPAGADVSAVRACQGRILDALIASARADAAADAADGNLQRMVDLSVTSRNLGFPARADAALAALAAVLRGLLAEAQAICPSDEAAAAALVARILAWAPQVPADEDLAADATAALEDCEAPEDAMVRVLGQASGSSGGTYVLTRRFLEGGGEECTVATLAGAFAPDPCMLSPAFFSEAAGTAPPVTLTTTGVGTTLRTDVTMPDENTVAWDVTETRSEASHYHSDAGLLLEYTIERSGTLTLQGNRGLSADPPGVCYGEPPDDDVVACIAVGDEDDALVLPVDPGTRRLQLLILNHFSTGFPINGRALTITFSPG